MKNGYFGRRDKYVLLNQKEFETKNEENININNKH